MSDHPDIGGERAATLTDAAAHSDPARRADGSLTALLWASASDVFDAITDHPFLRGVADGELEHARFAAYISQDSHYMRAYTQCLSIVAGRAPDEATTGMLVSHAAGAIGLETALHAELFDAMGLDYDSAMAQGPSPTTLAYSNHLLAQCQRGSFLEGLVAVLPCYWIYARVGQRLVQVNSPDSVYARWIENYSGGDYEDAVVEVLAQVDRLGEGCGQAERERCLALFRLGARYEWMFWDAAHRRESWPI